MVLRPWLLYSLGQIQIIIQIWRKKMFGLDRAVYVLSNISVSMIHFETLDGRTEPHYTSNKALPNKPEEKQQGVCLSVCQMNKWQTAGV